MPLTRGIQMHNTPSPCGGLPTPALTCARWGVHLQEGGVGGHERLEVAHEGVAGRLAVRKMGSEDARPRLTGCPYGAGVRQRGGAVLQGVGSCVTHRDRRAAARPGVM